MPFQPGQSGNPGGRPKEATELRDRARKLAPKALTKLAQWLDSDDPRASIPAIKEVLDRGFGKPIQPNEHSGPDGGPIETKEVSAEDRLEAIKLLIAKAKAKA